MKQQMQKYNQWIICMVLWSPLVPRTCCLTHNGVITVESHHITISFIPSKSNTDLRIFLLRRSIRLLVHATCTCSMQNQKHSSELQKYALVIYISMTWLVLSDRYKSIYKPPRRNNIVSRRTILWRSDPPPGIYFTHKNPRYAKLDITLTPTNYPTIYKSHIFFYLYYLLFSLTLCTLYTNRMTKNYNCDLLPIREIETFISSISIL